MYALWGAYCTWGGDMVESIFHRYCYTSFCFHRHTSIVMLSSYVYHHFLDVTFDEIAFLHLLYLCLPFMPYLISFLFSFYFHQLLTLFIVYMGFSFIVLFSPSFFFLDLCSTSILYINGVKWNHLSWSFGLCWARCGVSHFLYLVGSAFDGLKTGCAGGNVRHK